MRINKIKRRFDKIVNDLSDNEVIAYAYAFCMETARRSDRTLAESLEIIFKLDMLINKEGRDDEC